MNERDDRFRTGVAAAATLALAVRVVYVLAVTRTRPLGLDADSYRMLGLAVRDGLGYVGPPDAAGERLATATFPPGFPGFIALLAYVGGRSLLALRLALAVVGTVNVVLVALVARRVAGARIAVVAALLAAVYLPLVTTDGSVMSESLYLTFVLLATWGALTLAHAHTPSVPFATLLGGAVGLAALTRSEGLLLVPFVVAPALLVRPVRSWPRALSTLGVVAFTAVVVLVPWHVRNYAVFDQMVWFSGNSATAVAGAACDRHYDGDEVGLWTFGCLAHPQIDDATDEAELYAAMRRGALEYQRDHISDLPRVTLIRELRSFGLYRPIQQAEFEAPEGRVRAWQVAAWVTYLAVLALAVPGAAVLWRRRARLAPLAGLVAMVVVSTALTYGNQRFRVAAEPAFLVAAATTVTVLVDRARSRTAPVATDSIADSHDDGVRGSGSVIR